MEGELIALLEETREKLSELDVAAPYAYTKFIREQTFLNELVKGIADANNKPGIYHCRYSELGYKQGLPSYKIILLSAMKEKTLKALDEILEDLLKAEQPKEVYRVTFPGLAA